ncbi:MAG: hypothetical protein RR573_10030 [Oscillospiraceae bacterium]
MLDVPGIAYFKGKNTWCADHNGVRCRIAPNGDELVVYIWQDPWCFEKTEKEKITDKHFAFTQYGLQEAIIYANEQLFIE